MKNILLIFAFVLITGMANAQSDLKWYRDYQKSVEWDHWLKSQPKKRIEAVKYALKQSKDINSRNKKSANLKKKEDRIRKRINSFS